jgi:hypothetical protein
MNLDFLIPSEIIEQCKLDYFNLVLRVQGIPAQTLYPKVKVTVNNTVIYNAPVIDYVEIPFCSSEKVDKYQVTIEYHDKTANDTVVDEQGNILENQHVKIKKLVVNGIDIISTQIIYNLGNYTKNLTNDQQEYYLKHGYEVGPTHSLEMYENGQWTLDFKMPVLSEFIKLKKPYIEHERRWVDDLNHQIYRTINNIRTLEKKKQL